MTIDYDYGHRIKLLVELMFIGPDKPMKRLQREALKYYPLYHTVSVRQWMSWPVAMQAADMANRQEFGKDMGLSND